MKVLPIGYPLGFLPTGEYAIERIKQQNINLSTEEFVLWTQGFLRDEPDNPASFKSLIDKGAIIIYEDSVSLMKSLEHLVAMRFGEGWFQDGKICVVKDGKFYYLTETQHNIWLESNGIIDAVSIFTKFNDKSLNKNGSFINDFCDSIFYLVKHELLCLK